MEKRFRLRDRLVTAYWSVIGMLSAAVCTVHPVMADSIFDRIRSIVTDIYGQIVAISTIVAVTVASIALIRLRNSLKLSPLMRSMVLSLKSLCLQVCV